MNEIVLGYGNGTFGPEYNTTREQIATILYRYEEFAGMNPFAVAENREFADMDSVSGYAKEATV